MTNPALRHPATVEQYLAYDASIEGRSEYYNGEIFDMAGGTAAHARIARNLLVALDERIAASGCEAYGSDLKLRIELANAIVYPDLMVICGDDKQPNDAAQFAINPNVVIEVLSDSTSDSDQGKKRRMHFTIPSLQEYVLVDQNAAIVEVYSRDEEIGWHLTAFHGLEDSVPLHSLGISIPMKDIYRNVHLDA